MTVTPQLIRKYFGDDAKIERRFFGGYRVTTWTGGDLDIDSDGETRIHAGGDDVYQAMVLMLSDAGGPVTVWGGAEHITAAMSHGIANDVVVIPEVRQGGGCLRFFVVMLVFFISTGVLGPRFPPGKPEWIVIFIALAVSRWVWVAMKKSQKRPKDGPGKSTVISSRACMADRVMPHAGTPKGRTGYELPHPTRLLEQRVPGNPVVSE